MTALKKYVKVCIFIFLKRLFVKNIFNKNLLFKPCEARFKCKHQSELYII